MSYVVIYLVTLKTVQTEFVAFHATNAISRLQTIYALVYF